MSRRPPRNSPTAAPTAADDMPIDAMPPSDGVGDNPLPPPPPPLDAVALGASQDPPHSPRPTPGRVVLYRYRQTDGVHPDAVVQLRPGTVVTVHPAQFPDAPGNSDGYGVRILTAPNDFADGRASHWIGDAQYGTAPGEIHYPPRS